MGRSDNILHTHYRSQIEPQGDVALLGYTNNNWFSGDLYDRSLDNWNITSPWELPKKYDTIICTRCAYFAKYPEDFIVRCYNALNDNGKLYVDWGLGDHWRFENYKIGWVKDEEHEHAYGEDNLLWSTVWDDLFLSNREYLKFAERVKAFGYPDVKKAIFEEVPSILQASFILQYFRIGASLFALWEDLPQLYILIMGQKR